MIVEYERERDMTFISKSVNSKWVQLGFTRDEVRKIFEASHSSRPVPEQLENTDLIKDLEYSLDFYKKRCNMLQCWQSSMRDPERNIVCDILANGYTLTTKEELDKVRASTRESMPTSDMVTVFKESECTHRFPSGFKR